MLETERREKERTKKEEEEMRRRRIEEERVGEGTDQKKGREREESERTNEERGERARGKSERKFRESVESILKVSRARVTRTSHTSRYVNISFVFVLNFCWQFKF